MWRKRQERIFEENSRWNPTIHGRIVGSLHLHAEFFHEFGVEAFGFGVVKA